MKKNLQSNFNIRQYMESDNFELFYYNDNNFSRVETHTHNYYEFYFFVEGNVSMWIEGSENRLQPGDMILIPPEINHYTCSYDNSLPYRRFVFWISKEYFQNLIEQSFDYEFIANEATKNKHFIYHNDIVDFNEIQAKLFRLLEEMKAERFGKETKIHLCICDLLLHINRLAYAKKHPQLPREKKLLYENLLQHINDHLEEDLSLDSLANAFFVSKYHIAHIFKEYLGISIHQYITKKRLAACRDSLHGDTNISKTFQLYGFKDYSVFYRAFKKEYGISPKEYKELYISSAMS